MTTPKQSWEEKIEKLLKNVADKDEHGEWWGFDTNVGDLKEPIAELKSFISESIKEAKEEAYDEGYEQGYEQARGGH